MKKYILFFILLMIGALSIVLFSPLGEKKLVDERHSGYSMNFVQKPSADAIVLNEPTKITFTITNDKGDVLKDFAVNHEKLMHVILVRKDLMQFQHLHPVFDKATGEFTFDVVFTVDGPYRLFADFTPARDNSEKLAMNVHSDLDVGDVSQFQPHAVVPDEKKELAVPPDYDVTYAIPSELRSQEPLTYSLTIRKNNQPVTLEKYLGALGHSVILKEGTLEYIHTHAGEGHEMGGHEGHSMPGTQASNKVNFTTTLPDSGKYKIFTQFQHTGTVYTSEYVIEVK